MGSASKRDIVLDMIRDALSYDNSNEGIRSSFNTLKSASAYLKDGWRKASEELLAPLMGAGDGHMIRSDKDYCWQELSSAYERIKDRQKNLNYTNYGEIHERLYRISDLAEYGDPYEAHKEIKSTSLAMKGLRMEQHQYKSLRQSLDTYWEKASRRISEKREEGIRKRREWQSNMKDKVSRLSDTIDKIHSSIDKLQSHREKLRDMRDSAWSPNYKDRVDGWIDEVDDKIHSAYKSISEIESKIEDIKSKL